MGQPCDSELAHKKQIHISDLIGKKTIIAVAHRLSTIKNADEILVLEDGKIAEQGTHSELIEEGGIYARMYRIQSEA